MSEGPMARGHAGYEHKNNSPERRAILVGRFTAGSSGLRRHLRRTGARAEHGPDETVNSLG